MRTYFDKFAYNEDYVLRAAMRLHAMRRAKNDTSDANDLKDYANESLDGRAINPPSETVTRRFFFRSLAKWSKATAAVALLMGTQKHLRSSEPTDFPSHMAKP